MAKKVSTKKAETEAQEAPVIMRPDADLAVEKRLVALYTLQSVDSEIDKIQIIRGELPQAVQDLAEFIGDAMAAGADIYMTGDLKYHDFQRAEGRMVLADIGHYESEQFAKEIIFRAISEKFSNFACRISDVQQGIVSYI